MNDIRHTAARDPTDRATLVEVTIVSTGAGCSVAIVAKASQQLSGDNVRRLLQFANRILCFAHCGAGIGHFAVDPIKSQFGIELFAGPQPCDDDFDS